MITVTVEDLILEGIHGVTHKEKQASQRFGVDMTAEYAPRQRHEDRIDQTLDYRVMKQIAYGVIGTEQYELLETIAERIGSMILEQTEACSVTVRVRKLDIWQSGIPGVALTKQRLPARLNLKDFDSDYLVDQLARYGGVSLELLPENRRQLLCDEALGYSYEVQPEVVGPAKVREQLSSCVELPRDSSFFLLQEEFTELLHHKLGPRISQYFPHYPLKFNELSLQLYEPGSIGITPHRDGRSLLNLICVVVITGRAEFALCDDRAGNNPRFLDTTPGNVIIMRAPGFLGSHYQPFHFVRNVTERRIVFGLRYKQAKGDEVT